MISEASYNSEWLLKNSFAFAFIPLRNKLSYKTNVIIVFLSNNGISYRVSAVTEKKQQ